MLPVDYIPLLLLFIIATILAAVSLALPHFLGPKIFNKAKQETVESGKINYGDARRRVPVQYYVIAMIFILFDLEILFLFPWAVAFWDLKWFGLIQVGIFTLLLIESFIYIWKKGVFEWGSQ
ncbi:MAG TPA: NADH-quinone oxidoreductase subunit A [Anaerolineae bacterium]|nr:NADH-quinone oxidoreductase subunit A [Anaerolineae bacterium]HMR67697.1 NADH-quinone oxidoreductase subunit A [Anaerolineae bacterium]